MRHRLSLSIIGLVLIAAPLRGQGSRIASSVPAAMPLRFVSDLALDDSQVQRLRALERLQTAAMDRAISAYLRAEADFLDASRGEDLVSIRSALEKRARTAIDGEMMRLKAEKDTRAVLTAKQAETYASLADPSTASLWAAIVAPSRIGFVAEAPADSGEVRISVTPVFADIVVDDVKVGTGRRIAILPVGAHQVKLHAVGCNVAEFRVVVLKGVPTILTHTLTCGR